MPASNELSTTPKASVNVDVLMGTEPIVYDAAILAALLRSMHTVENELFASGLTKPQQALVGRLRHYRAIIWRMIPEGI